MTTLIAIPDIHGAIDQLKAVLALADRVYPDARLVFLGDYISRGIDPLGVLKQVKERCDEGAIALRGNHEEGFLDFVFNASPFYLNGMFGGQATIDSLERSSEREMADNEAIAAHLRELDLLDWLSALPFYWRYGDVVFTHAPVKNSAWGADGVPDAHLALWGRPQKQDWQEVLGAPDGCLALCGHCIVPDLRGDGVLKPLAVSYGWYLDCGCGSYEHGVLHAALVESDAVTAFITPNGVARIA